MFNWKVAIFGGLTFVGGVLIGSAITNILIRKKAMAEAEKIYIGEVETFKELWNKNHPESLEKIESEEAGEKISSLEAGKHKEVAYPEVAEYCANDINTLDGLYSEALKGYVNEVKEEKTSMDYRQENALKKDGCFGGKNGISISRDSAYFNDWTYEVGEIRYVNYSLATQAFTIDPEDVQDDDDVEFDGLGTFGLDAIRRIAMTDDWDDDNNRVYIFDKNNRILYNVRVVFDDE